MTIPHPTETSSRTDQQVSIGAFSDRKNLIACQAIHLRVDARFLRVLSIELDHAAVLISDPNPAGVVLMNGNGLVARKAFRAAVHCQTIVAQTMQGTVSADPQIFCAILEQAPHQVVLAYFTAASRHEMIVCETRQSSVGTNPYVPGAIFKNGSHQHRGKTNTRAKSFRRLAFLQQE
jgi:hypothetical protein